MGRWYVYIVRCKDGSFYTGATNDLAKRVAAHNAGAGARYTRPRRPVTLVWSRLLSSKSRALSVEARVKQLSRDEKAALVGSPTRRLPARLQPKADKKKRGP